MPRNLSAWKDLAFTLAIMLMLILILALYDKYLGAIAFLVWALLVIFAIERCKDRLQKFREYCENVIGSGNEMMRYVTKNIPQAMMVIDEHGRLEWFNDITETFAEKKPEQGMLVNEFWKDILKDEVLEASPENESGNPKNGSYVTKVIYHDTTDDGEDLFVVRYFKVRYRQLMLKSEYPQLTVLFVHEVTSHENLKLEYRQSRTVLMYVQVDNYDEVMRGLNDAEKTALMLSVTEALEEWMNSLAGFIQRISSELFIVVLQQYALNKAIAEKFTILDKIRQIVSKNGIPVTLSIGVAVAEKRSNVQSMAELGTQAQEHLNSALARGGET